MRKDSCTVAGHLLREGDVISIDGTTGQVFLGEVPVTASAVTQALTVDNDTDRAATGDDLVDAVRRLMGHADAKAGLAWTFVFAGERKVEQWRTLLQARAIENQAYVVGCNRVGTAGDGTPHVGDSRIVSPMGELLATAAGVETIVLADVDAAEVAATRDKLRFLPDRRG